MGNLRRNEEHGRGIFADGHASAAGDAGSGIHCRIGFCFANRNGITIGRPTGIYRDEAPGLDDAIKRGAIRDQVPNNWKRLSAPWLDGDGFPVLEMPHVKLAGGGTALAAMRDTIDHE